MNILLLFMISLDFGKKAAAINRKLFHPKSSDISVVILYMGAMLIFL